MSNLKFRAWHKEVKKYYEVEAIDFMTEEIMYIYGDYYHEEQTKEWFHFNDIILEQYTGLKDINGVEIYEGDVLFHPLQGRRKVYYPYSETVASYGLRDIDNGIGSTLRDSHAVWEVIGNVYEHPELLKENRYE